MKKMYSVLASLSMLLSMPAVASSFSERLMKEGCEDFDAEAIQQDDALLIAIEARASDVAALAAERMVRRHAERTMPLAARRELA